MFKVPDNLKVIEAGKYRVITLRQAMNGYVVLLADHQTESRPWSFIGRTANGNYIVEEPDEAV